MTGFAVQGSVKQCCPVLCVISIEAHTDLILVVFVLCKGRQLVQGEPLPLKRFAVWLEFTAERGAEDKYLANSIGVDRKIMLCTILDCNDPNRGNIQSRLLLYLLDGILSNRDIHITPSAGETPFSVGFFYQKNSVITKDSSPGIDLGGLIARLITE